MGEETTRLKEEIDRTRQDLTRDVNRLSDKTSPSQIVERRVQRTRNRLVNLKEKVMGSSDAPQHASYGSTNTAVYGGPSSGSANTSGHDSWNTGGSRSRVESARQATEHAAFQAVDTVREDLSSARDSVSNAGERASDATHDAVSNVREQTEGNPLAAGLVAFGVGWLVSSLLPASDAEAQAARRVGEVAREHGGPVLDQAKQAATEVAQELKSHAQDAAAQVKDTAQQAASEVKDATQEHAQATREEVRSSVSG